jgi:hypothetical protein
MLRRALSLAGLAALLTAVPLRAQDAVIIGQAVFKDSANTALGYSVVIAPGTQLLTGSSGKFLLRGLGPGPVKVTVKHIGFAPRDTVITLGARDTVRLDMALSRLVISLPEVLVTAKCTDEMPKEPLPPVLSELFDQVRQNAERYKLLGNAEPFKLKVVRVRGHRTPDGRVAPEAIDTILRGAFPPGPYEPKKVIRKGVGEYKNSWVMAIPELPDLADTSFLNNHCLRYAGKALVLGDSVIRVDYEPVPWLAKDVDIFGTLYLRTSDYQLVTSVTTLNRIPGQFYGSGMSEVGVTARFTEIVPGVPVLDQWVLESRFKSKRLPPAVETGDILSVIYLNGVTKPDTGSMSSRAKREIYRH